MSKTVFKFFVSLCLILLCLPELQAGHDEVISSLSGSKIAPLPSGNAVPFLLKVEDQQRSFMTANPVGSPNAWTCRFGVKEAKVDVQLRYSDIQRYLNNQTWSLNITYTIKIYNAPGSANAYTTIAGEQAAIDYSPSAGYNDIFLKSYGNAYGAELTVTNIAYVEGSGGTQTSIPSYRDNDIFLDLVQRTERYYNLNYAANCGTNAAPTVTVTTPVSLSYVTMANLPNSVLPIAWNYIEGAESFDVEWLFIDAGNVGSGPFGNLYAVDFQRPPASIPRNSFITFRSAIPKASCCIACVPLGSVTSILLPQG